MRDRETLAVTGAAGHVAGLISAELRPEFRLRRIDRVAQTAVDDDELVIADMRDLAAMTAAFAGTSGVLHLAGKASEDDFRSTLLPLNLDGTWTVFEAAVRAGVRRVVFASTGQVGAGYEQGVRVLSSMPPRPISIYACTKLFGEALGRFHADSNGLRVASLRLGWVVEPDSSLFLTEPNLPSVWCAPRDLARLILATLGSDVPYACVFAVSPPATERFDVANPYGWSPTQVPSGP